MRTLDREILRLAIPSIFANITVSLVGIADLAVAGHLSADGAAVLIGGVTLGSMLFDMLYWCFSFLRTGTGGLTAQAFGRGSFDECARIFGRGVGMALGVAAAVLLIQWPYLKIVSGTEEVHALMSKYFLIRIWAAPATLSLFSIKGWFIGMQDSFSSMCTDLVVNGVNVAASIILALGIGSWKGMGFSGIATGTVIAQYSGLLFAGAVIAIKYRRVFKGFSMKGLFKGGESRRLMTMNRDYFVRSVCLLVVYVGFTAVSAGYGDMILASGAILMKLLMLFSYFTDGFAYAGEALVGRYIGARDKQMTLKTVVHVLVWSMSIGTIFVVLYVALGVPMLRLFTSDAAVVDYCRQFLIWLLPMPFFGCLAFTWDGLYEGATASKPVRNSALWSAVSFFGVWIALALPHGFIPASSVSVYPPLILHSIMAAYFAHLLARSLYQTLRWRKSIMVDPFPAE